MLLWTNDKEGEDDDEDDDDSDDDVHLCLLPPPPLLLELCPELLQAPLQEHPVSHQAVHLGTGGVTTGSLQGHYRVTTGSLQGHYRVTLGSLQGHNRVTTAITTCIAGRRLAICREPRKPGLCKIFRAWV